MHSPNNLYPLDRGYFHFRSVDLDDQTAENKLHQLAGVDSDVGRGHGEVAPPESRWSGDLKRWE